MPSRSSERRAGMREARVLRAVFLAGAVTDAVALLPMPLPSLARLLWGLHDVSDSYRLAMRYAGIFERPAKVAIVAFALLAAPMADLAAAQDRPGLAGELAAGWVGFADDGIVSESLVGGAVRWYLLPRISVGPELAYIH